MKYVLDTGVVIQRAQALSHHSPILQIYVTPDVVSELRASTVQNRSARPFLRILEQALTAGTVRLFSPSERGVLHPRLSSTDVEILAAAAELGASVVSDDYWVIDVARSRKIRSIGGALFEREVAVAPADPSLRRAATAATGRYSKEVFIGILASILASLVIQIALPHAPAILTAARVWAILLVLPVLGLFLYAWRQRLRFSYGLAEFLVGIVAAANVFAPSFSYDVLGRAGVIQLLGALYVMVRGLDNIGQGIAGTRWSDIWRRLFGT